MSFYPYNPNLGQEIQGVPGTRADRGFITHQEWAGPAQLSANAIVNAATPGTVTALVVTSPNQPDYARALSVVGSNASVAGTVEIEGTNIAGGSIAENIVLNGTVTVNGNSAFASVSQVTIPAQANASWTVSVGTNNKLGLVQTLPHNTFLMAFLDGARESNAPTMATHDTLVERNTITLNSALDGDDVDVYFIA